MRCIKWSPDGELVRERFSRICARSSRHRAPRGPHRSRRAGEREQADCKLSPAAVLALARLAGIYRRLEEAPQLRRRFLRLLPLMAVGEWTLGADALRSALGPRPRLREQSDAGFR
jgi:hypothetical protein